MYDINTFIMYFKRKTKQKSRYCHKNKRELLRRPKYENYLL